MEVFFGVLCSVLGLLLTILPIVSLVSNYSLRRTVEALERRVVELEAAAVYRGQQAARVPVAPAAVVTPAPVEAPAQPEAPAARPAPAAPPPLTPPPAAAPPAPPRRRLGADALGVWALAIPGGLALLFAAIFALREAINAGLIGPGARFALGAAVGAAAVLLSEVARARRYDVPAAALGGGGAGIFYAVIYAGHARYGLFGQELAFGLMLTTTAATLLAAERRNSPFMATLAMIGGYLTPILLSTGENKAVAFFGYLALLDAGLLFAASRRRWTALIAVSAVVTASLYVGWATQFRAPDQVVVGLAAPAVLGLLYLSVAARRATQLPEALAAGVGAALLFGCGAAFVAPADVLRTDPVSNLSLVTSGDTAVWSALGYLLLATGALLAAGRRRDAVWLEGAGVTVGALLVAVFALGWALPDDPAWAAVAVGLVAVPLVTAAAGSLFWAIPVMWSGVLFGTLAIAGDPPPMAVVALVGVSLALVGSVAAFTRGPRVGLLPALVGATLPLLTPLAGYELIDFGTWFLGLAVVYAAFAFPPFWKPRPGDLSGALSAALVGPALFFPFHRLWIDILGDSVVGVLPVLLGGVTLLAAVTLVRTLKLRQDDRELAILVTVVLLFASGAVPLQLDEAWLTVGWAVEVALLAVLSRRLTHPIIRVFGGALAFAVCVRLLLNPDALSYGGGEGMILLNWTLYTWGVPAVCLLVAGHYFPTPEWFRTALRTAAVFLFFALVNLEVAHAFAHDDVLSFTSEDLAESMTRSIAWAAYGLVLIAIGTFRDARGARLAGLGFALLGAFKVFGVDLWSLSGFARVGAFAGLAVTLLIGAVAFQRIVLKDRKP